MNEGFLLDEQLPAWWRGVIRRLQPQLRILDWCEMNNYYLLTNNRSTMPGHLADHNARGRHVPGIFMVDPATSITDLANDLSLIEGAAFPGEYQDQFRHLPCNGLFWERNKALPCPIL
jgi:hypothetical protein